MLLDFLETLFGTNQTSDKASNNTLSSDPKEVITILGKGNGYDYFGQLLHHAKAVIELNRKNPQRPTSRYVITDSDRDYNLLLRAITEPIVFQGAYIEGNFMSVMFRSDADPDISSSYNAEQYVGEFQHVYIEIVYHLSELLIKNNKLHIVRTINTTSDWPRLRKFKLFSYRKYEVSEKRFFVFSGNVRNSSVERVGLHDKEFSSRKAISADTNRKASHADQPSSNSGYIKGGWTRHDAFSQILHDNPPRTEYHDGDIVVLNVKFNSYGHTYCYRAKDDVYKPGDIVEVKVSGAPKAVTVESVGYYSEEEYPFDVVPLNYVEGMATGELAERYKETIEAEVATEEEREKIRKAALKELKTARKANAEATKMHDEATEALKEAEEKKRAAEKAVKDTKEAGEKARQAEARLEAAQKEAAKTWKRKRPQTDSEIIRSLRKVQDALDEDEQIYRKLSDLEAKMSKVIEKSEEFVDEEDGGTTNSTIEGLYSFYLPKTISVLEQYKNIFSSGLPPKNVEDLRRNLLEAIDKSEEVYNNVLNSLYEKDMMELSIEMEVLQRMFAMSGLLDSDFDIKA